MNHAETAREIVNGADVHNDICDCAWLYGEKYRCQKLREYLVQEIAAALDQARAEGGSCDEAHTPDEYEQEYQIVKAERDALKAEVARLKETRNLADGLNDTKPRGHTQQEP